jgi:D-3-phosphoglycerate dehydrogenase
MLSRVDGIVLCAGLNMDSRVIDLCPQIKVIGRHGVGLDIVDVSAATLLGIPVVYTPEGPTESTAEHAFLLMLAAARKLSYLDQETRKGEFQVRDHVVGRELKGKKVGVVGYGRIGQRFAQMCHMALDMDVYYYDPLVDRTKINDAKFEDSLIELAENVEILSIHCPLIPETRKSINKGVLKALGSDGILINCSRGPVVDETALVEALQKGEILAAGLDVYDPEPPSIDNPLFKMDNVVLTPHLASFTEEGRQRMGMMVVEDVLRVLRGEMPVYPANPEVLGMKNIN